MTVTKEEYDAATAATATARGEIAELRGQGVGEIMSLAGDPKLLKIAAEVIKSRGLNTTPQAYIKTLLEKQRDVWVEKYKTPAAKSPNTLSASNAAVAAYRAKLNGSD